MLMSTNRYDRYEHAQVAGAARCLEHGRGRAVRSPFPSQTELHKEFQQTRQQLQPGCRAANVRCYVRERVQDCAGDVPVEE